MNQVFGKISLNVLVPVESKSETLGLLQANYKVNTDMIAWELYGTTSNGDKLKITVCDCENVDLTEYLD